MNINTQRKTINVNYNGAPKKINTYSFNSHPGKTFIRYNKPNPVKSAIISQSWNTRKTPRLKKYN